MKLTLLMKPIESTEDGIKVIDLIKHDKTQFYEIKTIEGRQIKTVCHHYKHGSISSDPGTLLVELLVPYFNMETFPERQFGFSFGSKGFYQFSGQDLIDLSSNLEVRTKLRPESEDVFHQMQSTFEEPKSNKGSMMSANSNPSSTVKANDSIKSASEEETKGPVQPTLIKP